MKLRSSVRDFANEMERTLRLHDDRGGWGDCSIQYLKHRFNQEIDEVNQFLDTVIQLQSIKWNDGELNLYLDSKIRDEIIDVANFIMMIWDNLREEEAG